MSDSSDDMEIWSNEFDDDYVDERKLLIWALKKLEEV